MKRSFSKLVLFTSVLALIAAVFFILTTAVRTVLNVRKLDVESRAGLALSCPVAIGAITYAPPAFIVFEDVSITLPTATALRAPLKIQRIMLRVSLVSLLTRRTLAADRIHIIGPVVDCAEYPFFLKENLDTIVAAVAALARDRSMTIVLDDARVILTRHGGMVRVLTLDGGTHICV